MYLLELHKPQLKEIYEQQMVKQDMISCKKNYLSAIKCYAFETGGNVIRIYTKTTA